MKYNTLLRLNVPCQNTTLKCVWLTVCCELWSCCLIFGSRLELEKFVSRESCLVFASGTCLWFQVGTRRASDYWPRPPGAFIASLSWFRVSDVPPPTDHWRLTRWRLQPLLLLLHTVARHSLMNHGGNVTICFWFQFFSPVNLLLCIIFNE